MLNRNAYLVLVSLLLPFVASADTFVVDSSSNEPDSLPGNGVCRTLSGVCTLLAALQESQSGPETLDVIDVSGIEGTFEVNSVIFEQPIELLGDGRQVFVGDDKSFIFERDDSAVSGITLVGFRDLRFEGENARFEDNVVINGGGLRVGARGPVVVEAPGAIIRNNRFDGIDLGVFGAIDVVDGDGAVIESNVIGEPIDGANEMQSSIGIALSGTRDAVIRDNIVTGVTSAGIASFNSSNLEVTDNFITATIGKLFAGVFSAGETGSLYRGNTTNNLVPLDNNAVAQGGLVFVQAPTDIIIDAHEAIGTGASGIYLEGASNVIVLNSRFDDNETGIRVDPTSSEVILSGNAVSNNTGLGIDVAEPGVLVNGPDAWTDYPDIGTATAGIAFAVTGLQTGEPGELLTLEFFESAMCDESGFGEGARFLGSGTTEIDASGSVPFMFNIDTVATPGSVVTATATGSLGSSELSRCVVIEQGQSNADAEFIRLNQWTLNTRSRKPLAGYFPSTPEQDPELVELDSLMLEQAEVLRSKLVDIDDDGDRDLVVYFEGAATGASCGTAELELTGLYDGLPLSHIETVALRSCN